MKHISLPKRVGLALKKRREALGVSQEDFAEVVAMHRTYYSSIERGVKNIRVETLKRICSGLQTPMWEVMQEAEAASGRDRG